MEENKTITDYFEIIQIFESLHKNSQKLSMWQKKSKDVPRLFYYGKISKIEKLEEILRIIPYKSEEFKFEIAYPIYLCSEDKLVAWKTFIKRISPLEISIEVPKKLSQVNKDYLKKLEFIEVENEEKFKDFRSAPRKAAKEGQMIVIIREKTHSEYFEFLYDLSQGGMAFLVDDPNKYSVGEKITLIKLDGTALDRELVGEVVAVRKKEETLGEFKVCVKFL